MMSSPMWSVLRLPRGLSAAASSQCLQEAVFAASANMTELWKSWLATPAKPLYSVSSATLQF